MDVLQDDPVADGGRHAHGLLRHYLLALAEGDYVESLLIS